MDATARRLRYSPTYATSWAKGLYDASAKFVSDAVIKAHLSCESPPPTLQLAATLETEAAAMCPLITTRLAALTGTSEVTSLQGKRYCRSAVPRVGSTSTQVALPDCSLPQVQMLLFPADTTCKSAPLLTGRTQFRAPKVGIDVGEAEGWREGTAVGWRDGWLDGCAVGREMGCALGWPLGWREGCTVGRELGWTDGWEVGRRTGWTEGCELG